METSAQPSFPSTPIYDTPKLATLPVREQPAFRVIHYAQACTQTELLSVLIGGQKQIEIAQALLMKFGGDIQRLYKAHPVEMTTVKGVSETIATRIAAAFNLGLRLNGPPTELTTINSPGDAAALVQYEMGLLEKEHLRVILLDRRNRVMDVVELYQGSVNSSQVRVAEIFRPAIQHLASAIILVHNHPSGDPTPSPDDVALTRAIVQSGKMLDIDVLDHMVIGGNRWASLKERGLGFA